MLLGDVIVPDNNICPRMLEVSRTHDGASVIAVLPVPDEQVHRFGIIDGAPVEGEDGFDTGTVETWLDTNNKLYARKNG